MSRHAIVVSLIRYGVDVNLSAHAEPNSSTGHNYVLSPCTSLTSGDLPLSYAIDSGYVSFVRILLLAGSRTSLDDIRNRQLKNSPQIFDTDQLIAPVLEASSSPHTLMHICRSVIRHSVFTRLQVIRANHSGPCPPRCCLDDIFSSLPVAARLRRYLMFDDLGQVTVERARLVDGAGASLFQMQGPTPCGLRAIEGVLRATFKNTSRN